MISAFCDPAWSSAAFKRPSVAPVWGMRGLTKKHTTDHTGRSSIRGSARRDRAPADGFLVQIGQNSDRCPVVHQAHKDIHAAFLGRAAELRIRQRMQAQ
jgi:hypothetical protein